jgi:hypothetical protein
VSGDQRQQHLTRDFERFCRWQERALEVDRLLARATAKRPEERFASMGELADACGACARTLEGALVERGVSLTARELWRKTPSASGVEGIGAPSAALDEHDTAPASRPPFFGGLSSSTAVVAPGVPRALPQSSQATPQSSLRGSAQTSVRAPQSLQAAPPQSLQAAPPQSLQAAPPPSSVPSPQASDAERDPEDSPTPFAALLWGMAVGSVIFGAGAWYTLRAGHAQPAVANAVATNVPPLPAITSKLSAELAVVPSALSVAPPTATSPLSTTPAPSTTPTPSTTPPSIISVLSATGHDVSTGEAHSPPPKTNTAPAPKPLQLHLPSRSTSPKPPAPAKAADGQGTIF